MAKRNVKKSDAEQPGFEDALTRLDAIVHGLEEGQIGLEESLGLYEEGAKLLRRCCDLLSRAERRIELLSGVDADGNPITAPMEDDSLSLDEKARRRSRRRSAQTGAPPSDVRDGDLRDGDVRNEEDGDSGVDATGRLF